jgi:ferredoxin
MRIEAEPERCVGAGMCVLTAARVFSQDETDGTVILLVAEPPAELHSAAEAAVYRCPSGAIRLAK